MPPKILSEKQKAINLKRANTIAAKKAAKENRAKVAAATLAANLAARKVAAGASHSESEEEEGNRASAIDHVYTILTMTHRKSIPGSQEAQTRIINSLNCQSQGQGQGSLYNCHGPNAVRLRGTL